MRVVVVTPPQPVVTLAEAKAQARVEGGDFDAQLTAFIAAAQGHIDGPAGWLGRAIGLQTLEARFDNFGAGQFALPYPPVVAIETVKYLRAGDGAETLIVADQYELLGDSLASAYGTSWPAPRYQREAVRVRYKAGYPVVDGVSTAPDPIKAAILLMVGDLWSFRETAITGTIASAVPMSTAVEALLAPFRVWR